MGAVISTKNSVFPLNKVECARVAYDKKDGWVVVVHFVSQTMHIQFESEEKALDELVRLGEELAKL